MEYGRSRPQANASNAITLKPAERSSFLTSPTESVQVIGGNLSLDIETAVECVFEIQTRGTYAVDAIEILETEVIQCKSIEPSLRFSLLCDIERLKHPSSESASLALVRGLLAHLAEVDGFPQAFGLLVEQRLSGKRGASGDA
jgi:hypothetical protein